MHYQDFTFDGTHVEGRSPAKWRWEHYGMPSDLTGLSVLDIGSSNGFFAMEAKRLGAREVTAIDYNDWLNPQTYAEFQENLKRFGFQVHHEIKDIYTLGPAFGQFDVVFFLQVLYHMHDPFLAMRNVASVCKRQLWIETTVVGEDDSPMAFYPAFEGCPIPVMWPSPKAVEGMIRWAGFDHVRTFTHPDLPRGDIPGQLIRRMAWRCDRL